MAAALTHHDDLEVTAGDDWVIDAFLTDADGAKVDLTSAEGLIWYLIGPDGQWIAGIAQAVVTTVQPATDGHVRLVLPRASTAVQPGRYHDALRTIFGGNATMTWTGTILVAADPAASAPPP